MLLRLPAAASGEKPPSSLPSPHAMFLRLPAVTFGEKRAEIRGTSSLHTTPARPYPRSRAAPTHAPPSSPPSAICAPRCRRPQIRSRTWRRSIAARGKGASTGGPAAPLLSFTSGHAPPRLPHPLQFPTMQSSLRLRMAPASAGGDGKEHLLEVRCAAVCSLLAVYLSDATHG